jgi:hypothetical protein
MVRSKEKREVTVTVRNAIGSWEEWVPEKEAHTRPLLSWD